MVTIIKRDSKTGKSLSPVSGGSSGSKTTKSGSSAPAGSLTFTSGGQQWIATPNKDVTQEQIKTAKASGWTPYSGEMPTGGNVVKGGQPLPPVDTTLRADIVDNIPQFNLPTQTQAPLSPLAQSTLLPVTTTTQGEDVSTPTTEQSNLDKALKMAQQVMGLKKEAPSATELYRQVQNEVGIRAKEQAVNNLAAQINAISSNAQANILSTQGQGRGIPEVIIGGQQAQIQKEAAIQALPLQALLSAAQNDLDSARSYSSTLFELMYKDAVAETEMWNRGVDMAYDIFTKSEQNRIEDIRAQKNQDSDNAKSAFDRANKYFDMALEMGNQGVARQIAGLQRPTSSNPREIEAYTREVERIASKLGVSTGTQAPKVVSINGVDSIWDGTKFVPASVAGSSQVNSQLSNGISLATSILSGDYKAITGAPGIASFIPGTEAQRTRNQAKQLAAILALNNREKLKGSGAISDYESRILNNASSALGLNQDTGRSNLSNTDFANEVKKVRGVFQSAAGLPVNVTITDPKTGRSKTGNALRDEIESAALNGYLIAYN